LPPTQETTDQLLWTKYWDWKYEKEWQGWLQLVEREGDHYFYSFDIESSFMRLREVIVGPLCDITEAQITATLNDYSEPVKIIKARLAFNAFRIVVKENGFESC
jgi:hypothetical protein